MAMSPGGGPGSEPVELVDVQEDVGGVETVRGGVELVGVPGDGVGVGREPVDAGSLDEAGPACPCRESQASPRARCADIKPGGEGEAGPGREPAERVDVPGAKVVKFVEGAGPGPCRRPQTGQMARCADKEPGGEGTGPGREPVEGEEDKVEAKALQ